MPVQELRKLAVPNWDELINRSAIAGLDASEAEKLYLYLELMRTNKNLHEMEPGKFPDESEKIADEIANHLAQCILKRVRFEIALSNAGMANFLSMVITEQLESNPSFSNQIKYFLPSIKTLSKHRNASY